MPKRKHEPQRSCVACRRTGSKLELIRVVRTGACTLELDPRGRLPGRGAYLCREPACVERAVKARSFERALGCPLREEVLAELRQALAPAEQLASASRGGKVMEV